MVACNSWNQGAVVVICKPTAVVVICKLERWLCRGRNLLRPGTSTF